MNLILEFLVIFWDSTFNVFADPIHIRTFRFGYLCVDIVYLFNYRYALFYIIKCVCLCFHLGTI